MATFSVPICCASGAARSLGEAISFENGGVEYHCQKVFDVNLEWSTSRNHKPDPSSKDFSHHSKGYVIILVFQGA
jgi:hypothetical protein